MKSPSPKFEPKISIVVPVYNGSNYLAEAIDSALAQTYPNVEIVVVDDGSTDGGATQRIAESYGSKIKYIQQENQGCGGALNTGITRMSGEYFSWLSHDDVYLPDKLSRQVAVLAALDDKNTIIYGNYDLIDERSRRFHAMHIENMGPADKLDYPLYPLTRGLIHGCTLLIPRAHFDTHGLFDPALKATQDYDLWFRIFRHAPIKFDAHCFVLSRVHAEQSTRRLTQTVAEGNRLWTRFVEEVTPEEAARMDSSHYRYLTGRAAFLEKTIYAEVAPIARAKAARALADTLVSVVIPFRDRVDWTIEALRSAQRQTHARLEIILVDDGSTEDVRALTELAGQDPRVRYERQEWRGASAARNRGVALANGSYIAFLDSDDYWAPQKIARQLTLMENEGLALSHTGYERLNQEDGSATPIATAYFAGNVYPQIISFCPMATPTVMVRADVMRACPFPEQVFPGEDIIAWISITCAHEVGAIDDALTTVRISPDTTSASTAKSQRGILNILSSTVGHPVHGVNHREILELIDVMRRYEQRLARAAPKRANVGFRVRRPSRARSKVEFGLELFTHGVVSLRRHGVRATWNRVRTWRAARAA